MQQMFRVEKVQQHFIRDFTQERLYYNQNYRIVPG